MFLFVLSYVRSLFALLHEIRKSRTISLTYHDEDKLAFDFRLAHSVSAFRFINTLLEVTIVFSPF